MQDWQQLRCFWFGADAHTWPDVAVSKRWFASTKADDTLMAERFGDLVAEALAGGLVDWEGKADSRLALILLLDQLPRNIYRGSAKAFAGDARACALATTGVAQQLERTLPWAEQVFFYMPLMHAEDAASQALCIDCFQGLAERVPAALKDRISGNLKFAYEHQQIIERFGRFPHRNAVLGRESTRDELAFLEHANRYGQ